mgnify:CR=1 FL=1|tara:strand:- start:38078 stop:39571 length:1494 start_codon:yes stop_codon:yes gene_type:complete
MFLKTPRITGLLFNCAMNCALPRLLENIDALVVLEHANNLPSLNHDAVYTNHERLKAIFTTHYGIDNTSCTWEKFYTFLNTHSFYAQEIMFAPVFRIFIAEMALQSGQYKEQDLWRIRDIQDIGQDAESDMVYAALGTTNPTVGRYNLLPISEISALFYAPLALGNVTLYEHEHGTETYHLQEIRTIPDGGIPLWIDRDNHDFSMYLREDHYELLPKLDLTEPTARFIEEINTLPGPLGKIHEILSSSQSAKQSNEGLGRLVTYVHDALGTWINEEVRLADAATPRGEIDYDTYKQSNAAYYSTTDVGRATFAAILLAIAARTPAFKALAERLLQQDKLSPELIQVILNPSYDLTATFETIQPSTTNLAQHGVFNTPHRKEFKTACTKMIRVLSELHQADKITKIESDALRREIRSLYRNPESHEQFLQTMQQCEERLGGKFIAYCMLAAGYAAKICSLGYLGDTWIEQANQTLEHIKTLENFASEAEVFYKSTQST